MQMQSKLECYLKVTETTLLKYSGIPHMNQYQQKLLKKIHKIITINGN